MRGFIFKLLNPNTGLITKINNENNTLIITTRLYSGTDDGWKYIDFHKRCDFKGKTVTLFQIKNGDCIGGYTSQHWESSSVFKGDSSAFLFNLNNFRHFPSNDTG